MKALKSEPVDRSLKTTRMKGVLALGFCLFLFFPLLSHAQLDIPFQPFYVYKDRTSTLNHFFATGWMGDHKFLTFQDDAVRDAKTMDTCIKISYRPPRKQGNSGWAGIYWQNPMNNWGSEEGSYDLTGANRLSFLARGEEGNEVIAKFQIGGVTGQFPDSTFRAIYNIRLTKEWAKYSIDLADVDLSSISGGFCFVVTKRDNVSGATFFIDEICYE
ncbi:MAG: hypothetical protein JW928_06930 [Candidatus Aureabacteria bacterium]|nr:hypothetical protein [Candidatus Auribacterota bacterium]